MRRLNLTQLLKNATAFTFITTITVDASLLLADRVGVLDVPGSWYVNAPLAVWMVTGIPTTIALAERLVHQVNPKPGRIIGFEEGAASPVMRAIGLNANGKRSTLLASVAPSIFGSTLPQEGAVYRPSVWYVPVGENRVIVRESELRAFLDVAARRDRYQFSRRYWLEKRRPPLYRDKYDGFMRLLVESGLVEGRRAQGRASGRLVTKPRHAVTYLKYESPYRTSG